MGIKKQIKLIGYWGPGKDESWDAKPGDKLPMPVARDSPWRGQAEFLKALWALEGRLFCRQFKGWSECRICGCKNGSGEFTWKGFQWPNGYSHYIERHNLKPPLDFRDAIAAYIKERKALKDGHQPAVKRALPLREPTSDAVFNAARSTNMNLGSDERCALGQLQHLLKNHLEVDCVRGEFVFKLDGVKIARCSIFTGRL